MLAILMELYSNNPPQTEEETAEIQNLVLSTFSTTEMLEAFLDYVNEEGCTEAVAEFLNGIYEGVEGS